MSNEDGHNKGEGPETEERELRDLVGREVFQRFAREAVAIHPDDDLAGWGAALAWKISNSLGRMG